MRETSWDDPELAETIGTERAGPDARGARAARDARATPSTASVSGRAGDAGVLRQRHEQLRPRAVPRPLRRPGPAAAHPHHLAWARCAPDDPRLLGLRLQDPGEHGPAAPRPHRLRAHLLGQVHARHGGAARAHRQDPVAHPPGAVHGPGAHHRRRGLLGRHHRALGSRASCASATACARAPPVEFEGIPRFSPEHFVRVRLDDPLKRKQLKKGLEQLSEEGAVQLFFDRQRIERDPILGAVGVLQFEVIEHRLAGEYRVEGRLRAPALPLRPLDRGGRPGPRASSSCPAGRPASSTSRGARWCCSRTSGSCAGPRKRTPSVQFIAAVQPGRSSRSAA